MEVQESKVPLLSRLPQELISQIFEHTLPSKPSFTSSSPPLLLTHVCRSWRTRALNTARLWARFSIPDWGEELPREVLSLVKLFLDRAGEAPLDVDISLFNEDIMVFPDSDTLRSLYQLLRDILKLLEPKKGKIARFRGVFPEFLMNDVGVRKMLNAEHIYYCGMLGDKVSMGWELGPEGLDEAEVEARQQLNVEGHRDHTRKLDVGPQRDSLRSLGICGCAADLKSVQLQTQLTHLELLDLHRGGELCQETAFTLLRNMPKLKYCIMDLTRFESPEWPAPEEERLVLNNMDLLFFSWVFPADIDMLLRSISAPKLTKLGLRGTPMVAQRTWTGLSDFLSASKAPIERISLGDFSAVDFQPLRCFQLVPTLVHLTINHAEIHDEVFRTLTCTDELYDPSLLPNLQVFNMGVCEGFRLESVVNFLKARTRNPPEGVSRLTEVAIMYCMSIEQRHTSMLRECGVQNLIVEAAEDDSVYPYARVVETHRELLAVLYKNDEEEEEELPPFPSFDEEDTGDGGTPDGEEGEEEEDQDETR